MTPADRTRCTDCGHPLPGPSLVPLCALCWGRREARRRRTDGVRADARKQRQAREGV